MELEKEFKLENVNKSPAVFDIEKLNNINANILKNLGTEDLKNYLTEELKNLSTKEQLTDGEIALIQRGGYRTLVEAAEYIKKIRAGVDYEGQMLVFRKSDKQRTLQGLKAVSLQLSAISEWKTDMVNDVLLKVVEDNQLSNGDVFWPVRVALSSEEKSPSPVELAVALGREKTIKRIEEAIIKLG